MKVYMDELPKGCQECPCYDRDFHACCIHWHDLDDSLLKSDEEYFKPEDCPLIQIVQCKDCRFSSNNGQYCDHHMNPTLQDAFCSAGRRKA